MKVPFKRLRYSVGETILDLLELIMTRMPLSLSRFCFDALFFVLFPIISLTPAYKKTTLRNVTLALGNDYSRREIRRIARGAMRNIFRMPPDVMFYGFPPNFDLTKKDIKIVGTEHLTRALKRGKGVVGLGSHMTGFLLLTVRLANSEIPFVVPTKDPRNPMLKKKLRGWRDISNVRYIDVDSPDKGKRQMLACLAKNELVYLIADERKKRDGILLPFFGRDALTAVGPAALSLKTGAPIVPIYIANDGDGFQVDILPPLFVPGEDAPRSVEEVTARANKSIEEYIRKYPDQWVWTQDRWRL
jgi:KDO2-lipid IV(A) lauroyltransferase